MDIKLEKKPWYVRFRYYLISGAVFLTFVVYVITVVLSPRQLKIDAEEYRIVEVVDGRFLEYIDVEGLVQPIQTVQINALENGFVERIVAEEGAMLKKGDTILVLSNPELLRLINDEQAEWENSCRNYREQEIEMQQKSITLRQQSLDANHQMRSLEKSLRQSREEYHMGVKSKAELEIAEEDYEYQKQKTLLQIESLHHDSVATMLKREMVQANKTAADKKLARSNNRTDNLVVRATTDGQLSFLNAALGQRISSGTNVASVKVLNQYKIGTNISEYYIDRINVGLSANIQYQDKKFPLYVSKVVPEVKERNFACDLVFRGEKPGNIRLGKSYRVLIELEQPEKALVISKGNFYQQTAGKWIFRLSPDGKTARKVDIEIGRQNPQQYEILSGLKAGDKVIVSGYDKIGNIEELIIK